MAVQMEIEKKYIIEYPDIEFLKSLPKCDYSDIEQIYLVNDEGLSERIRKRVTRGRTRYYHTIKKRISDFAREENEVEINELRYEELKKRADPNLNVIYKTRYVIPYGGFMMEIDVFPFWDRQAYLEVELDSVDVVPSVPEFIHCLCCVSSDPQYTNRALAEKIPQQLL